MSRRPRSLHSRARSCATRRSLASACLQLVVGQAHRVEESVPAGVAVEIFEERIFAQIAQAGVALPARALQPFESPILVTAIGVSLGNLKRSCFGIIFR